MVDQNILILGGYGNTGTALAHWLLKKSNARLVIAGRHLEKAAVLAEKLNQDFGGNRVSAVSVDASDLVSLKNAFSGIDIVVMASSTTQYTAQVATAALEARAGYLDIQYSSKKLALLNSMSQAIQQAGCCFITDGGFHPGLPAFMVRYVAQSLDRIVSARVGSVIKEDWNHLEVGEAAINELVELINDYEMSVYKHGKWQKVGFFDMSDYIRMDFGGEFGKQYCAPMLLAEMRILPEVFPSLVETGFYVGSFNWFVDWVVMPLALFLVKLWPRAAVRPAGRWMYWGLKKFSKPPYGTMLKVEAVGEKDGRLKTAQLTISHPDGYQFTAIPMAACLLQYLDGSINRPGLWMQAHVVEPNRFMSDMQAMGITIQRNEGGGNEVGTKRD